jgi:hypothetical protein
MADFNPDEYIAQKSGDFDPDAYIAQKGKVTVEAAPKEEKSSSLPKLGTWKDAANSAERMAIAFAKPPAALAEYVGWGAPAKQLLARDEQLKEQSGLGGQLSSLAGDVAGFVLPGKAISSGVQAVKAIPKVAELAAKIPQALEAAPALSKIVQNPYAKASAAGAGASLLNPAGKDITEEGFGEERGRQAITGAVAGPVLAGAGKLASNMLDPALKRLAELKAQGIDTEALVKGDSTLGQILGGGTQAVENFLKVFPFSGLKKATEKGDINLKNLTTARNDITKQTAQEATEDISKIIDQDILKSKNETSFKNSALDLGHKNKIKAENQSLADEVAGYSNPVIEDALAAANLKLSKGKVGNAAVEEANNKLSQGYENFHNEVGSVPFLKSHKDDIKSFLDPKNLKEFDLTPEFKNKLENDVADLVNAAGTGRKLSTRVWQAKMQKLGDKAFSIRNETENKFEKAEYAKALTELKDQWMRMVEDATGRSDIRQLNQAHSLLQAPTRASTHLKTMLEKEGDFDPQTLIAQLKNDMPQKRFASLSDARVKDAIAKYQDVAARKAKLAAAQEQRKLELDAVKGTNQQAHDKFVAGLQEAKTKASRNVNQQATKTQEQLNELVGGVHKEGLPSGILNKLGYVLAAAPAARLVSGAGSFMGVPGAGLAASALNWPAIGAAALGPVTRATYTHFQPGLKAFATRTPSAQSKAAAQQIRQNLPQIGGLGGYLKARTGEDYGSTEDTSEE